MPGHRLDDLDVLCGIRHGRGYTTYDRNAEAAERQSVADRLTAEQAQLLQVTRLLNRVAMLRYSIGLAQSLPDIEGGLFIYFDENERIFARYGRPPVPLAPTRVTARGDGAEVRLSAPRCRLGRGSGQRPHSTTPVHRPTLPCMMPPSITTVVAVM